MADPAHYNEQYGHDRRSIGDIAERLARILGEPAGDWRDATATNLEFHPSLDLAPLDVPAGPPAEVWAVDGGQALVADARCLQVYVTRAARMCWRLGRLSVEEQLPMQVHLLGLGEDDQARAGLSAPVAPGCSVDVNLLRDWAEWAAVHGCVAGAAAPGAVVLMDGDLEPDWRISRLWTAQLMDLAADRGVLLAGVTKHTSLSWGGAPLVAVVERLAGESLGPRRCWWAPVARTSPDAGPGTQVVVARMDPDAPYAFRVDLPGTADPEAALQQIASLGNDAAFPGYPYPLSAVDRAAACGAWVRRDVWQQITEQLAAAGVAPDVVDRAFADRHRLMER